MNEPLLGFMVNFAPWIALVLFVASVLIAIVAGLMTFGSTRAYVGLGLFLFAVPLVELLSINRQWTTIALHTLIVLLWSAARLGALCVPLVLGWMALQQRKAGRRAWPCLWVDSMALLSLLAYAAFLAGLRMLSAA